MAVERKFITKDGNVLDSLPEDQMTAFRQRVMDMFTPILYDYEMRMLALEQENLSSCSIS